MSEDHSDLIDVPVPRAMEIKFNRGRANYDHGPWVGPDPLYCSHDEILDFLVYIHKASSDGSIDEDMTHNLMKQGLDLIQGVRVAIKIHESKRSLAE